jgi:EAL domain-containing protein (putative c-di-GMP-specific phosphodiesterase class I)
VAVEPTDLDRLLLEADIALYQAKAARHSSFEVFEEPALRDIMRDFPTRVADGAVRADLQPQFDLVTGEVVGFEALARWSADGGDPVPAAVWIKAVEQLGGADLLFAAVARSVAAALTMVGDRFTGRYWLNLSPLQLGEAGSAERLLGHLDAAGLVPDRVGLEVVETAAVNDLGLAAENLGALRAAGVAVALDDFGSGFTPLGHLTALPVDLLKLDRSVVAALDNRPRQAALVEAMVTIAERLGIGLVAEGIETEAERDTLLALGVRCGQGYLLGHPAPPATVVDLLAGPPVPALGRVPVGAGGDGSGRATVAG